MFDNKQRRAAHSQAIARPDQALSQHLSGVGAKARELAQKLNLEEAGYLIGLLHDFGKYSEEFQQYIKAIEKDQIQANRIKYDEDEEVYDHKQHKGKIDHSTAGAQWIWKNFSDFDALGYGRLVAQVLSICIASHHSGLIDFTNQNGNIFSNRMRKSDDKTHLKECEKNCDLSITEEIKKIDRKELIKHFFRTITPIYESNISSEIKAFYLGMLTKFLFSCLIDADRLDSAGREIQPKIEWDELITNFEHNMGGLKSTRPINNIRKNISGACLKAAQKKTGVFRLTVPTGGGKTFASLRYAIHHAKKHNMDRIIYIIPYTSIIEQNADQIRKILNDDIDSQWVLEHHSNLEPEQQTWHSKLACENWDRPIILTTMVQFLEVLFGAGTRGVRRLHQLTNSVLIFDEIQNLPVKCFHLFCNAINFFTVYAKSTAVLCTATQPSLDLLKNEENGRLNIPEENEIMGDCAEIDQLFNDLSRVNVQNCCKNPAWDDEEIAQFVLQQFESTESVLVIVNTKSSAKKLFNFFKGSLNKNELFYLSTNLCSTHRKTHLDRIRKRLDNTLPVLCISTQLIEAGVDISFKAVVRYLAGLDSIAQAAGRCNRHAEMGKEKGNVFIINSGSENLGSLEEIKIGQEMTARVVEELPQLAEYLNMPDIDLLHPETLKLYFKYYFEKLSKDMAYEVGANKSKQTNKSLSHQLEYETSMLELLSENTFNGVVNAENQEVMWLRQAFMTAGKNFAAIDAPTKPLIVQYAEGKELVTRLSGLGKEKKFEAQKFYELLRKAQRYSVNIYPNDWDKLQKVGAIAEIQGEGIFYLDERYYCEEFGVSTDIINKWAAEIY